MMNKSLVKFINLFVTLSLPCDVQEGQKKEDEDGEDGE